jgi:hypothetical protein
MLLCGRTADRCRDTAELSNCPVKHSGSKLGALNLPMVVSAQRQILGGGLAPLRPKESNIRTLKIISYTEYQQVQFRFLNTCKSDQDRLLLRYYVE